MSLSALVNGAECGPVNPLQGLTKRFEADRGASQDQFHPGRAGPSREVFRTPAQAPPALAREAAEFFQGNVTQPAAHVAAPFDLSALNAALVAPQRPAPIPLAAAPSAATSSWAKEFASSSQQTPNTARSFSSWAGDFAKHQSTSSTKVSTPIASSTPMQPVVFQPPEYQMAFATLPSAVRPLASYPVHRPAPAIPTTTPVSVDATNWESHFTQVDDRVTHQVDTSQAGQPAELSADDLATTAGLLLNSLSHEQKEKFKNSAFMGLMRKVRDREVIVSGNDMVPATEAASQDSIISPFEFSGVGSSASSIAKGKMRETDPPSAVLSPLYAPKTVHFDDGSTVPMATSEDFEDWIDALADPSTSRPKTRRVGIIEAQEAEWAQLTKQWEEWTTAPNERMLEGMGYVFQANNPYLNPEFANSYSGQTYGNQSVLEKEAAVQRNPFDANAWLELGIKQQENEREAKAIAALTRALELDSTLLPAWLSLAISYTNEGNRHEAYGALQQWVENNEKYKIISARYHITTQDPKNYVSMREKRERLIQCLIDIATMANDIGVTTVDADVQIALAVLLNSSEDYDKAVDCFKTALEVRPDDWVLYNRVGATLANSGKPEEALAYYYRALEYNPTYIRVRYNLGISCINLRRYEEAASHLLDALVLQEHDTTEDSLVSPDDLSSLARGVTSSALWDTLRTTCHHLRRLDLAALCERRDLDGFRAAFQSR
ncbi:hypothetical protein FRB99_003576 [Tulasnella sp. 403]|nr:hypothetical protein FRB99_003576 [Tulasnella sp. 403]